MTRLVLLFVLLAGTAMANLPESVKRPVMRPAELTPAAAASETVRRAGSQVPRVSLRPKERTRKARRAIRQHKRLRARGAVCGDPALQGEVVGRVRGRLAACGVADAVRIKSVSDVRLSQASVMDCGTAQALRQWVDVSVKPNLSRLGGGVAGLRVAAHYACRTRNNRPGARVSEHGKGRAIDISGFRLRDGSTITVLKGWHARQTAQALRQMHRDACGPFGTVLGPEADSYHRDHFHFDTARYRSGTYCR
ncbi:extensin family protein [uncultured Roseobacter sp.]|uniref:extensin-like domain-containing protein n=1 Tax=uncultured Roseobacter sp. TaxID=114847 RepID=UPI00260E3085|nr:extensin family protein [uncultured Roseobacter sp.]